jgi:hypothetical protein
VVADDLVTLVAGQLGRPADALVELDRRPLALLTDPGPYVTLTLRDRGSRQVLEPTVDLRSGRLVDAAGLRQRDRDAVERRTALTPRLRRLLLRHPDLPSVRVSVQRAGGGTEEVTTDAAGVLALADDPGVVGVDRRGDVVVLDGGAPA